MKLPLILFLLFFLAFAFFLIYGLASFISVTKNQDILYQKIINPDSAFYQGSLPSAPVGYQIDGNTVKIWNNKGDYYFNRTSGIQWTQDPEGYWSKNIFCIGYYQGGSWNKIKCADELGEFNREIKTDNETYVNATLWKKFTTHSGYNLTLAVNYYLHLDDDRLTITIYGKNRGSNNIPYNIGFAWKVTDIKINRDEDDSITINSSTYDLDSNLDLTFKNMTYYNSSVPIPYYVLNGKRTNESVQIGEIVLTWNENLKYRVKLHSEGSQNTSYVALLVNAGTLNSGQEKSTKIYWEDANKVSLYPTGDYDVNIQSSTEDTHWEAVNYLQLATYVKEGRYAFYNDWYSHSFDEADYPVGIPKNISSYAWFKTNVGTHDWAKFLFYNGTENEYTQTITADWTEYNHYWEDAERYTWDDIKNFRCGVGLRAGFLNGARCGVTRLEIYYDPDVTPPNVSIDSPLNTTYQTTTIDFNITTNDTGGGYVDTCLYTLNNGVTNYTMSNLTNNKWNATQTLSQGSHTVFFYCNDTAGNLNNTANVTFSIVVTDTSFTVTLPAETSQAVYTALNKSSKEVQAENQTSLIPFLNVSNEGNVNLDISIYLNNTLPADIVLKADDDNTYSGASVITTSPLLIKSALTPSETVGVWFWSDFTDSTPNELTRQLNVSSAQS